MKVNIGPYRRWVGPYQIADLLQKVGVSEDRCEKIGDYLNKSFVKNVCEYFYNRGERKERVKIESYDLWNLDHTLGLIILPALKAFRADDIGASHVDNEDVPEELRASEEDQRALSEGGDLDENWYNRWNYVLDEMIFAFENVVNEDTNLEGIDAMRARQDRVQNGLCLFGKYYQALWN